MLNRGQTSSFFESKTPTGPRASADPRVAVAKNDVLELKMRSRALQDSSKRAPRGFKRLQEASKSELRALRSTQRTPEAPKSVPRWSQKRLRGLPCWL